MSKKLLAVFIVLMLAGMAFATKHDDEALRFFRLNTPADRVADMIDENYDSVLAIFLDGMEQEMGFDLSAEDRAPMKELLDYIIEVGMDYDKLEEISIPLIKSQFSVKELEELNRFLSTKTGGKYLDLYILNNSSYLSTAIEQLFSRLSEDQEVLEKIGMKFLEIYNIDQKLYDSINSLDFDDDYYDDDADDEADDEDEDDIDSEDGSEDAEDDYQSWMDAIEELSKLFEAAAPAADESKDDVTFVPYDTPPQVIGQISPVYPSDARKAGIQGTVILEVQVYKDGSVGDILVKRSVQAGPGGLDEAAIAAVRAVSFEPGETDGEPVDTLLIIPIEFKLN